MGVTWYDDLQPNLILIGYIIERSMETTIYMKVCYGWSGMASHGGHTRWGGIEVSLV